MTDTVLENVSDTAFWVAHYRALETQRSDALFHDPLAGVLAGDRGKKIAKAMPMPFMTGWVIVVRTCIIDEYIYGALAQGVDAVLNLGAGLDTRPYRMKLPSSLLWVEADYPHMIEFKQARLSKETPRCRVERVSLDLANLPERRRLFASVDARANKILVLTEGVVPYLSLDEAASLADDLTASAHFEYWVVDYFSAEVRKGQRHRRMRQMKNAPFRFNPDDWFQFFADHGWHLNEIRYLIDESKKLRRPMHLPLPIRILWMIRRLFISAKRREGFRKFAGYALLKRTATKK